MTKLLLAAVVVAGVIVGAAAFSARHHTGSAPVQTGPVVVTVQVPNPLGGGQGGGNDQIYVP
jgi:hypothetical protein